MRAEIPSGSSDIPAEGSPLIEGVPISSEPSRLDAPGPDQLQQTPPPEEITRDEPTIRKYGAQLAKIARAEVRSRSLEIVTPSRDSEFVMPIFLAEAVGAVSVILGSDKSTGGRDVLIFIAPVLDFAVRTAVNTARTEARRLRVAGGYGLQCVRTMTDDILPKDKAAVVVLPRGYGDEQEPPELARSRLGEALAIVAEAHHQDRKGSIAGVVVPSSVACQAGLSYTGDRPYGETLDSIASAKIRNPYGDDEKALIIPADRVSEFAELLGEAPGKALEKTLAQIACRFPQRSDALREGSADILGTLHGLLKHELMSVEGVVIKDRTFRQMVDREGRPRQVFTGWKRESSPVHCTVDTSNPYNPMIHRYAASVGRLVDGSDLRSLTGGKALTAHIKEAAKLDTSKFGNLELIRVALELLEARRIPQNGEGAELTPKAEEGVTGQDAQVQPSQRRAQDNDAKASAQKKPLPIGRDPRQLTLDGERHNFSPSRLRFLARVALTVTAVYSLMALLSAETGEPDPKPIALQSGSIFRVHNHGVQSGSPYWAVETSSTYQENRWVVEPQSILAGEYPEYISPENTPHITVQTLADEPEIALPIGIGTALAAVRARDVKGHDLPVTIIRVADGTNRARVSALDGVPYELSYDLVEVMKGGVRATRQLSVPGLGPSEIPQDLRSTTQYGIEGVASTVRDAFTYDAAPQIEAAAKAQPGAGGYIRYLDGIKRCKCEECNTLSALVAAATGNQQNIAHVSGYLKPIPADGQYGYLPRRVMHAWLMRDATVVDATAEKGDSHSVYSSDDPMAKVDQEFVGQKAEAVRAVEHRDRPSRKLPVLPLAGLALAGAGAVELRYKNLRFVSRGVGHVVRLGLRWQAARLIDREYAAALMAWQEFGQSLTPAPPAGARANERNIGESTLCRVRNGGFCADESLKPAEVRGLRLTAASILLDRKATRRRAKTAK